VRWSVSGSVARSALAALLLAVSVARPAVAARDALVVVRGGKTRTVPLEDHRGFPAARAALLAEALGYAWRDGAMRLESEAVRFYEGSPFFTAGSDVYQLPNPVYRFAGQLMIPAGWALEWLPRARPRRWRYLDGRLVERPGVALTPPARDRWLVVVDPGHGGKDPGTTGVAGTREKDVALAIARKLAKRLGRERGIEVVLTRDRDTLVALDDRPRITQIKGIEATPDLFLSIHANSMPKKPNSMRGVETYFLAVAKTEEARRVAMRENSAVRFEADVRPEEVEPLQFILSDLQSTDVLRESSLLAATIDRSVEAKSPARSLGVRQAGFIVLVGATMPAVLVEVGYLSNPEEERLLRSSSYQAKIADALADAVVRYLAEYGRRVWSSYGSGG
jgi:N-acetylmuramoyl-L-alanine amidase